MSIRRLILSCLLIVGLTGQAWAQGPEKDKTYRITIMHTNDHHGRFWKNSDGEYGLSAQKTVIDAIRRDVAASGGRGVGERARQCISRHKR